MEKAPSTINTQAPTSRVLRIALVGCGKVADQHVHAIHRIPDCEIAPLCDRELLMAKQLGERCGVSACFFDLREMLDAASPDIIHITTPPQSHYVLARQCLESGPNVSLVTPSTITVGVSQALIQ